MPPKRVAKRQASPPSSSDERPASRAATPWPEADTTTVYQKARPLAGAWSFFGRVGEKASESSARLPEKQMPPSRSAVALIMNDPATLRGLPDPSKASSVKEAEEIMAVNAAVLAEEAKPTPAAASGRADKGKKHQTYTAEVATEIGKACSEGRSIAETQRLLAAGELKSYGLPKLNVPVSTIQRFRNEYRAALKQQYKDGNVRPVLLERRAPGRPRGLALAEDWLKAGILKKRRRYDLLGLVNRHWLESFKDRHGLVLRRATQDGKKLPKDWEDQRLDFLIRVAKKMNEFMIPVELIANIDQTGVNFIPSQKYTLDYGGCTLPSPLDLSDCSQYTGLYAAVMEPERFPEEWALMIREGKLKKSFRPPLSINPFATAEEIAAWEYEGELAAFEAALQWHCHYELDMWYPRWNPEEI
eukprot:tig00021072_g17998.t1